MILHPLEEGQKREHEKSKSSSALGEDFWGKPPESEASDAKRLTEDEKQVGRGKTHCSSTIGTGEGIAGRTERTGGRFGRH